MANKISFILLNVPTINDPKVLTVQKGEVFIVTATNTMYWKNVFSGEIEPLSATGQASNIAQILANTTEILANQERIKSMLADVKDLVSAEALATRTHVTNATAEVNTNASTLSNIS